MRTRGCGIIEDVERKPNLVKYDRNNDRGHNSSVDQVGDHPWLPLPDEDNQDYDRFQYYLRLGPDRSVLKAYENYCIARDGAEAVEKRKASSPYALTSASSRWYEMSERYHWQARAAAYDSQQHARSLAMLDEERELCRNERRIAFRKLMTSGLELLARVDLDESNLSQITQAINVGARGLRTEYGDDVQNKPIQLEALLAVLPDELRAPIVLALRATTGDNKPVNEPGDELDDES